MKVLSHDDLTTRCLICKRLGISAIGNGQMIEGCYVCDTCGSEPTPTQRNVWGIETQLELVRAIRRNG